MRDTTLFFCPSKVELVELILMFSGFLCLEEKREVNRDCSPVIVAYRYGQYAQDDSW